MRLLTGRHATYICSLFCSVSSTLWQHNHTAWDRAVGIIPLQRCRGRSILCNIVLLQYIVWKQWGFCVSEATGRAATGPQRSKGQRFARAGALRTYRSSYSFWCRRRLHSCNSSVKEIEPHFWLQACRSEVQQQQPLTNSRKEMQ